MSTTRGYTDVKDIPTRAMLNLKGSSSSSLPNQATPTSRRGPKFYKETMEALERMGLEQIKRNYNYNDSYAQIEGKVNVSHFVEGLSKYEKLASSMLDKEDYDMPEWIRNYDQIGPIVRHLSTKYVEIKSKFNVDFIDPITQGEFDRELNNRLMQSTIEKFELEKRRREAMWGIGEDAQNIPEEQMEEYQAEMERQLKLISSPEEIVTSAQREWKPLFIKWINNKIKILNKENDVKRRYTKFFTDKCATGKYFCEHKATPDGEVKVERWDPRYVFHSQNHDLEFPQDANIIGKIDKISVDNIITEHGGSLTEKEIKKLIDFRDEDYRKSKNKDITDPLKDIMKGNRREGVFPGTFANQALSNFEQATGMPQTFVIKDFENATGIKSEYINDYLKDSGDLFFRNYTRTDIGTEDDVIMRTKVYWTSYEKVSYIFLEEDGVIERYFVDERLIEDFLERKDIEKIKNITIDELSEMELKDDIEPNTMCSTYAPVTYYGVLLRTEGFGLKEDKIIEAGPCKIQLRGDKDDIYKEIKPVSGMIGEADIPKWMPYQIEYNYNQNLARKYSEKELGRILLFDIGIMSPEFSETGDPRDDFLDMQDRMREDPTVPVDASRKNLREGRGMEYNPIGVYDMTMSDIIADKMNMAQNWRTQLYQAIGLNPQMVEQPQKYVTAQGVKESQDASQTNIDYMFNQMDESKAKDIDIYIRVLQNNQYGKERIQYEELQDDGTTVLKEFMDEFITDRRFKLESMDSSEKRRKKEEIKNWILSTNTHQEDTYALAKIILSEDFTEMINTLKVSQDKAENKIEAQQQQERQHEMQLEQQRNENAMSELQYKEQLEERRAQNSLREKVITELIKSYKKNGTDIPQDTVATIKDILQNKKIQNDRELSEEQLKNIATKNEKEDELGQKRLQQQQEKIDNEKRRLELRERERNSDNFRRILQSK